MQRNGQDQQLPINVAHSKPLIPRNGNPYYNPETYLNSQLNMGNKRTPIKPDNFIGFKSFRNDNMMPNMGHKPTALNPPITIPVMTTQPVPKIYN
jgi:hypothetical protein